MAKNNPRPRSISTRHEPLLFLGVYSFAGGNKVTLSMTCGQTIEGNFAFFFHQLLYIVWKRRNRLNAAPSKREGALHTLKITTSMHNLCRGYQAYYSFVFSSLVYLFVLGFFCFVYSCIFCLE